MTAGCAAIERSPERDAAIRAILRHVPARGWTWAALRAGLADLGRDPVEAASLFPRGPVGAIEAWSDLADREMAEAAAAANLAALRTPARIRRLVELRLRAAAPHREALRRALALLALPWNAAAAARCTARTADAMWHAAGDRSADFSWYTRRASLAAIYLATLAYWLRPEADGADPETHLAATLAFLDRRMADLARLAGMRRALACARRAPA
ncbi:COQ9 family protein [Caldovatus aquaticus]|uniref:COQ9 family protein n=1 Tax=Caldovatus aquaticus TaxID=2865671 RepID=A0ABS7F731_9PROT|nr:COQ9 family protein [Caldovatus aquaticus]